MNIISIIRYMKFIGKKDIYIEDGFSHEIFYEVYSNNEYQMFIYWTRTINLETGKIKWYYQDFVNDIIVEETHNKLEKEYEIFYREAKLKRILE